MSLFAFVKSKLVPSSQTNALERLHVHISREKSHLHTTRKVEDVSRSWYYGMIELMDIGSGHFTSVEFYQSNVAG